MRDCIPVEHAAEIRKLLRVGVSKPWIIYHLGLPELTVKKVCMVWKKDKFIGNRRRRLEKQLFLFR